MARIPESADIQDLYRRYQAGESTYKIAESVGVNRSTVCKWFRREGLELRDGGRAKRRPADPVLVELYVSQRKSTGEIAALFGVNPATARGWVRDCPLITPRTQPESLNLFYEGTTAEERAAITAAAHDAVRGKRQTAEHRRKIARTREERYGPDGRFEEMFHQLLIERGVEPITQKAIGRFNVDFAANAVAVEIFGGSWHNAGRHAARHNRRTKHILDAGWSLVVIWVEEKFGYPLTVEAADYAISLMEFTSRNPAARREYRVIRGTGEAIIFGCADCDRFPLKPTREASLPIRCDHLRVR